MADMKPPKKGGKPKTIDEKLKEKGYGPGGPHTPGAKKKRKKIKDRAGREGERKHY